MATTNANRHASRQHQAILVERDLTGIVVTVFVERGREPISGWIEFPPCGRRSFAGWLDLASSLAEAKDGADEVRDEGLGEERPSA